MIKQLITICFIAPLLVTTVTGKELAEANGDEVSIPELDCVIEPSEIVDVGSALPGLVGTILADRSDRVKKGAVVVKMESSIQQATVEQAKLKANLKTSVRLREATAAFGHITQERNQELLKTSSISIQEMDQLKTETKIAELQVQQEKENRRLAQLEYARAKSILAQRSIRSPVDGVIMDRYKSVGEYVDDEPLLRIAQLDPLNIEVIVPVSYLGRVKPGMQAEVMSVVPGSETHLATVERVDTVADAASGTYGVRLNLSNPEHKVPAGLRCRLSFLPADENEFEEVAKDNSSNEIRNLEQDG